MRRRDLISVAAGSAVIFGLGGHVASPLRAEDTAKTLASQIEQSFLFGFALHEFSRTASESSANIRPSNVLARRKRLLIPTDREVTSPNSDTLYASAFLELSGGPIEVVTHAPGPRYQSITFMDAFMGNFARIGADPEAEPPGRHWIVGPDWQGEAPADVGLIRSDTNDVWMLGRTLVRGPGDLDAALASQDRITVEPVPGRGPLRPIAVRARPVSEPSDFLDVINDMLGRSPTAIGQARRAARFHDVGIRPGHKNVWADLPETVKAAWTAQMPSLIAGLRNNADFLLGDKNGWRRSPNGVGTFGDDDRLRATIARWALAALPSNEAVYYRAAHDVSGASLDGAGAYRFRLPAEGVPMDGFWSITVYTPAPDGRFFLVENPIQRYSVNDQTTDLIRESDGALTLFIQADKPRNDADAANWLPAPRGPFQVVFRVYRPRADILEGNWAPPPLVLSGA